MNPETLAYMQFAQLIRYTEKQDDVLTTPRRSWRLPVVARLRRLPELAGEKGGVRVLPCPDCPA